LSPRNCICQVHTTFRRITNIGWFSLLLLREICRSGDIIGLLDEDFQSKDVAAATSKDQGQDYNVFICKDLEQRLDKGRWGGMYGCHRHWLITEERNGRLI
jgi:hypothetical protein